MAGMKGRSGGKRAGAGRKPKAFAYPTQIARADRYIAPKLKEYAELIDKLARGDYEVVREKWVPAALVLVERVEMQAVPTRDGDERLVPVKSKIPAFPQRRPDEMVLVEKRITSGEPDLNALMYLLNRIMGKPAGQPDSEEADDTPLYDLTQLTGVEIETLVQLLEKAGSAPASPEPRAGGEGAPVAG